MQKLPLQFISFRMHTPTLIKSAPTLIKAATSIMWLVFFVGVKAADCTQIMCQESRGPPKIHQYPSSCTHCRTHTLTQCLSEARLVTLCTRTHTVAHTHTHVRVRTCTCKIKHTFTQAHAQTLASVWYSDKFLQLSDRIEEIAHVIGATVEAYFAPCITSAVLFCCAYVYCTLFLLCIFSAAQYFCCAYLLYVLLCMLPVLQTLTCFSKTAGKHKGSTTQIECMQYGRELGLQAACTIKCCFILIIQTC